MNDQYDFSIDREDEWFKIVNSSDIEEFIARLYRFNCKRCSLSDHNNHVVVCRGNPKAKIMYIGEGPGLVEDQERKAFVGPAGQLLEKIFASVNVDIDKDVFLSNIIRCRPVAKEGSGRQNYTPKVDQCELCKPYVLREIELIDPKIIIAGGRTAAISLFNFAPKTRLKHIVGKFFQSDEGPLKGRELFVMYHPAALLHSQHSPARCHELKRQTWEDIQKIKKKIDELGIKLINERK